MAKFGEATVEIKVDDKGFKLIMDRIDEVMNRIEKLEESKQDKIVTQFTIGW